MAITRSQTFKDILRTSRAANDPVPGLFWIAQARYENSSEEIMGNHLIDLLFEIVKQKGVDCFALHEVKDVMQAAQDMGVPAFRLPLDKPIDAQIGRIEVIATRLVPAAWSVAGMMSYFGKDRALETLLTDCMDMPKERLPGLQDPLAMPITQSPVLARSLAQPMGQWIPAFRDTQGRTHDLLDLSIAAMDVQRFLLASQALEKLADATPQAKAGYLGRQAAHVYDVSLGDIVSLRRKIKRKEQQTGPVTELEMLDRTGLRSESTQMVGIALQHGASISQASWSGPGVNERPFGHALGELRELVYTLSSVFGLGDDNRAETLKRMHDEGHDVVVLHRDNAEQNQSERRHTLPLHLWAGINQVQTVATLLQAGADTKALVYQDNKDRSKGTTALEVIQPTTGRAQEIDAMIRSADARQVAMDAISSMGLDGFCMPSPH